MINSDSNIVLEFNLQLYERVIPCAYSRGRQIRGRSKWVICTCFCYNYFFITRLIYFKLQINILFPQETHFLWADRRHIHSANILILFQQFVQEHLYRRVYTLNVTACLHKSWGETHKRRDYQCKQWFPVCTWALQATDPKHDILTALHHILMRLTVRLRYSFQLIGRLKHENNNINFTKINDVIMTLEQIVP